MLTNNDLRLPGSGPRLQARPPGVLSRILTTVAGVVVIAGALALSLVVFIAVASAAVVVGGYLWWKTRDLRKRMRESPRKHFRGGRIIEGEVIRDDIQH